MRAHSLCLCALPRGAQVLLVLLEKISRTDRFKEDICREGGVQVLVDSVANFVLYEELVSRCLGCVTSVGGGDALLCGVPRALPHAHGHARTFSCPQGWARFGGYFSRSLCFPLCETSHWVPTRVPRRQAQPPLRWSVC